MKLIDFGQSTKCEEDEFVSGIAGTTDYVAPEILREEPYNEKVDIWSIGVITYVILTGNPLFEGDHNAKDENAN